MEADLELLQVDLDVELEGIPGVCALGERFGHSVLPFERQGPMEIALEGMFEIMNGLIELFDVLERWEASDPICFFRDAPWMRTERKNGEMMAVVELVNW